MYKHPSNPCRNSCIRSTCWLSKKTNFIETTIMSEMEKHSKKEKKKCYDIIRLDQCSSASPTDSAKENSSFSLIDVVMFSFSSSVAADGCTDPYRGQMIQAQKNASPHFSPCLSDLSRLGMWNYTLLNATNSNHTHTRPQVRDVTTVDQLQSLSTSYYLPAGTLGMRLLSLILPPSIKQTIKKISLRAPKIWIKTLFSKAFKSL